MEPLRLIVESFGIRPLDATRAWQGEAGTRPTGRLSHHRRQRGLEGREPSRTARSNLVLVLVLLFLFAMVLTRTTLAGGPLPIVGSAGNASGQVVLPPLSVEIHDGGVDVYEGQLLIETVPWSDDDGLDDRSTES